MAQVLEPGRLGREKQYKALVKPVAHVRQTVAMEIGAKESETGIKYCVPGISEFVGIVSPELAPRNWRNWTIGMKTVSWNLNWTLSLALVLALAGLAPRARATDAPVPEHHFEFSYTDYYGNYLGRETPGATPQMFAPGLISIKGQNDICLVFSDDGKQLAYNTSESRLKNVRLRYMRQVKGRWTKPVVLEFSRDYACFNPIFSDDGKQLIFSMHKTKLFDYYYCDIFESGYTSPKKLDTPITANITPDQLSFSYFKDRDDSLYFCGVRDECMGGSDIYHCYKSKGKYITENLRALNSTMDDDSPFVSPEGNYLVYNQYRKDEKGAMQSDVMVSFKSRGGNWGQPVNYGQYINSKYRSWRPVVTHDGKYLFFCMDSPDGFDVYWVSTRVLEQLKSKVELSGVRLPNCR